MTAPLSPAVELEEQSWLERLGRDESHAGLALLAGTVAALIWANLSPGGYAQLWATHPSLRSGVWGLPSSPVGLINDGAMSLFFLVIGLELARAIRHGELSSPRAALLPVFAAAGGMAGGALAYVAVTHGDVGSHGYGIPTATDVAFSLGALSLLGRRVPPAVRAFVLALGVADDIGSLILLVLGYSGRLDSARLFVGLGFVVVLLGLRWRRVLHPAPYLLLLVALFETLVASGVEPALAGVAVGLAYPVGPVPVDLEHALRPVANLVVLPAFALANAGVAIRAGVFAGGSGDVFAAVVVARIAGKALGLLGATLLGARLMRQRLPAARVRDLAGPAVCCGVGFTVPLLIASRAFGEGSALLAGARAGLLAGSLGALGVGALLIVVTSGRHRGDR